MTDTLKVPLRTPPAEQAPAHRTWTVAVAALVFAHYGSYASPAAFLEGCAPALWVSAGAAALGAAVAALAPPRA